MSDEHKRVLWSLLRPAIVAMIVALLVTMGVEMTRGPAEGLDQWVDVAGVSHFSSVYSKDDVEAVDDLIAGDDVTVTDAVTAADLTASDDVAVGDDLAVTGLATVGETLGVTGASTLASLSVTGADTVGTFQLWTAATAISVTTNGYITPTGTLQPLTSFGNVFSANLSCGAVGRLIVLYNQSSTTITISDTGTVMLSGDTALGQYDTLWLYSDGTNCIELAQANN